MKSPEEGVQHHRMCACACVCPRVHGPRPREPPPGLQALCTPPCPVSTGYCGCGESGDTRSGRTLRSPGPLAAPWQPSHSYQGPGGSRSCYISLLIAASFICVPPHHRPRNFWGFLLLPGAPALGALLPRGRPRSVRGTRRLRPLPSRSSPSSGTSLRRPGAPRVDPRHA